MRGRTTEARAGGAVEAVVVMAVRSSLGEGSWEGGALMVMKRLPNERERRRPPRKRRVLSVKSMGLEVLR